jgi:hypothetical protein
LREPFVAFFQCQVCQHRIEVDRSSSATNVPPGEKSWAEVLHDFQQYDRALAPIRDGIKAVVVRARKRRD